MADEIDGENDSDNGWIRGRPDERPTMSLQGAGSTDWMATAALEAYEEAPDESDLSEAEYRDLRRAQYRRKKMVEAGQPKVLKTSDGELTEAGKEYYGTDDEDETDDG